MIVDFLRVLPRDTFLEIVKYSDYKIIGLLEVTCKKVQVSILESKIWEQLCIENLIKYHHNDARDCFIKNIDMV